MNVKNARYEQKLPSGIHIEVDVWREGPTLCQRWLYHDGNGVPVKHLQCISDMVEIKKLGERICRENPR